jgi:putative acetyltransferase
MSEIVIRGFNLADCDQAIDLFLLPRCIWGTLRLPYASRDAIRTRLETINSQRYSLVAELDGRIVGMMSIRRGEERRIHTGEVGLFVHDAFHGQGIGRRLTEACIDLAENWLGITRIELSVYVDNVPAIALYQSCGFLIEGTARNFCLRDGDMVDAHYMARLKPS